MAEYTWETGITQIKSFMKQAAECANPGWAKHLTEQAKMIWKEIAHLRPNLTPTSLKLLSEWKAYVQAGASLVKSGKMMPHALPPLKGIPVDLTKSVKANFTVFKALDPMTIFQLKEWFIDFYVYANGNEAVKANWQFEKGYNDYYWIQFMRGWKPSRDNYREYRRNSVDA